MCLGVCVQFQLSSSDSMLFEQERGGMEKSQILLEISQKLPVQTRTATGGQETCQCYGETWQCKVNQISKLNWTRSKCNSIHTEPVNINLHHVIEGRHWTLDYSRHTEPAISAFWMAFSEKHLHHVRRFTASVFPSLLCKRGESDACTEYSALWQKKLYSRSVSWVCSLIHKQWLLCVRSF